MKKIIFIAAFLVVLVIPAQSSATTLSEYFNGRIPSVSQRKPLAKDCGISGYRGTAAQNTKLLSCLLAEDAKFGPIQIKLDESGEPIVGAYNPVTAYQSRTTQYIAASATTIPVVSTNDKAGNAIDLSQISSSGTVKVYMNLAPGTSLEEPVICTGKTSTSWTGCTRGISFQGPSEVASTTLQKPHNAGTPIIITNIGQFYNQYVSVDGAQMINDVKTFTSFPVVTNTIGLPSSNGQFATKYYVDTVGAGGFTAANVSNTQGTFALGTSPETVGISPSSSQGAVLGIDGRFYQKVSTTRELVNAPGGTYINTSTLVSEIATTTPTPNLIPRATAAGTIPILWNATSTTSTRQFARSTSTGVYYGDLVTSILNTSTLTRAYAVSYRNDSGRTKFVTVVSDLSGSTVVNAFVSSTAGVGIKVGTASSNDASSSIIPMSFFVPPDWTYSVSIITGAAGQLSLWAEFEM